MEHTAKAAKALQNLRICSKHITEIIGCFPTFCVDNKHMKIHWGKTFKKKTKTNSFTLLAFSQSRLTLSHFSPLGQNLTSLKRERMPNHLFKR